MHLKMSYFRNKRLSQVFIRLLAPLTISYVRFISTVFHMLLLNFPTLYQTLLLLHLLPSLLLLFRFCCWHLCCSCCCCRMPMLFVSQLFAAAVAVIVVVFSILLLLLPSSYVVPATIFVAAAVVVVVVGLGVAKKSQSLLSEPTFCFKCNLMLCGLSSS